MKSVLKPSVKAVRLALLSISTVLSMQVMAQEQENEKVQKVEITGSNIKRINAETVSAIQIIKKKDIEQLGASTAAEILDSLSSNTGGLSDKDSSGSSFASGGSALSLRHLGSANTLILVNGRRVSPFALADAGQVNFTNVDSIPASLIERVEILKDGASAIYGSEAIAGVVNFITVKEFQGFGFQASVKGNDTSPKVGRDQTMSLTFGHGEIIDQGYNLFVNLDLYKRQSYVANDVLDQAPNWYRQYVNPNLGRLSALTPYGNFLQFNPESGQPIITAASTCPSSSLFDGVCRSNQYQRQTMLPASDRLNLTLGARVDLGSEIHLFAEASYSQNHTKIKKPSFAIGTGLSTQWFDTRNGQLKSYEDPLLPASNSYNPFGYDARLLYSFEDHIDMWQQQSKTSQYRLMTGLEGTYQGWDFNAATGVLGARARRIEKAWPDLNAFLGAIYTGEYKFGGKNSFALLNRMFPDAETRGDTRTYFVDARASRELMPLPGGPLSLATGFDFRRFDFTMRSSENVLNAEIVNSTPINLGGVQNQAAYYAEINAPIRNDLELIAAVRADKSGNAGLSVVPKVGAKYNVSKQALLRATYTEGFRAPNAAESGNGSLGAFLGGFQDPRRCATALNISNVLNKSTVEADQFAAQEAIETNCNVNTAVSVKSNPNLKPETSRSFSFGTVIEPSKHFSFALDYYHIERLNEISSMGPSEILAKEGMGSDAVTRLAVSARDQELSARARQLNSGATGIDFSAGRISSIRQDYLNLYRTRVSGLDLEAQSRWNLGESGRLNFSLDANYTIDFAHWNAQLNRYAENMVGNYAIPRYRGSLKVSWERGLWAVGSRVNFTGPTSLQLSKTYDQYWSTAGCAERNIPQSVCYYGADQSVDFSISYIGFKSTKVMLNIQNVLDRSPIIDIRAGSYIRGRTIKIGAEYSF